MNPADKPGPALLRKQMAAAVEAERFARYHRLRREWIRSFARCELTDEDRRAFANVERPAVSPTIDR